MRKLFAALLVGVLAASTNASQFTPEMTTLRSVLDQRLTGLDGLTDKQSKSRAKTLKAALKTLDKEKGSTVAADVAALASIAKSVEKAYGANDADLEAAFGGLLAAQVAAKADVAGDIASLEAGSARESLGKLLAKADPFFSSAGAPAGTEATIAARSKALKSGIAKVAVADSKLAKSLFACGGAQSDLFHATLDSTPYDPPKIDAHWLTFTDNGRKYTYGLSVSGYNSGPATIDQQVTFDIKGFYGVGAYPVTVLNTGGAPHAEGTYSKSLVFRTTDVTGMLYVKYYNAKQHVLGGTFDATFTTKAFVAAGGAVKVTRVKGKFRMCSIAE